MDSVDIRPPLSEGLLQGLVNAVADQVLAQLHAEAVPQHADDGGWLDSAAAAAYLGVKPKRIYDLKSMGALMPDGYDGRTPLYRRVTLDRYASSAAREGC